MLEKPRLDRIDINGFRPFGEFTAKLGSLEVLVGANGSGKSSLFEFLKFLRDSMIAEIPPEIVSGSIGRGIFHIPGPERFNWTLYFVPEGNKRHFYCGELAGPVGRPSIMREFLGLQSNTKSEVAESYRQKTRSDSDENGIIRLGLSTKNSRSDGISFNMRKYISSWRIYSSFRIADEKIRKSVLIEQEPILREDCGNLSSVLFFLMTEHPQIFAELQEHLKSVVPGFKYLTVKARGGPGEVIAFWNEGGVDDDLPIADLSDGIIRLICWITLCLHPNPPPLICIDEPDQGVHPRTLPILAGLFEKASERTQILLATHSSYFLTQFDISRIAVLRKENGEAKFIKPADSEVLRSSLEEFGPEEIEAMHRSDELERLP